MDPSPSPSMTSASPPSGEVTELVASEPNTVYVLPGDVLLFPAGDALPAALVHPLDDLKGTFDLAELVITNGINRPWILRKGVPISPGGDLDPPQ